MRLFRCDVCRKIFDSPNGDGQWAFTDWKAEAIRLVETCLSCGWAIDNFITDLRDKAKAPCAPPLEGEKHGHTT